MNNDTQPSGTIITFYSYKGGTGRTMALANIACLLSERFEKTRKRILMMDWDFEAPGLHSFFSKLSEKIRDEKLGVIDYFDSLRKLFDENQSLYDEITSDERGWQKLEREVSVDEHIISDVKQNLDIMKAGRFDDNYAELVNSFDWFEFYKRYGEAIRVFREIISYKYQYILVDSRIGLTVISDICIKLLPEKLVGVFAPNRLSLDGLLKRIRQAFGYRRASIDYYSPLAVFPLPSMIEVDEPIRRQQWRMEYQTEFQKLFKEAYGLEKCDLNEYFDEVQLPHTKFYAYGEEIAVLTEERGDFLSFGRAYRNFFERVIESDHAWQKIKVKVFISYVREDREIAEKLYHDLRLEGIDVWLDKKNLLPGQIWKTEISRAIRESSYFIAMLSARSISKKGFFQAELKKAFDILDEMPEHDIFLIPARIDNSEPKHKKLEDIHWTDLFSNYEKGLKQILMVLKSEKK